MDIETGRKIEKDITKNGGMVEINLSIHYATGGFHFTYSLGKWMNNCMMYHFIFMNKNVRCNSDFFKKLTAHWYMYQINENAGRYQIEILIQLHYSLLKKNSQLFCNHTKSSYFHFVRSHEIKMFVRQSWHIPTK